MGGHVAAAPRHDNLGLLRQSPSTCPGNLTLAKTSQSTRKRSGSSISFMTPLQKTLLAAGILAAMGGSFAGRTLMRQNAELISLHESVKRERAHLQMVEAALDSAKRNTGLAHSDLPNGADVPGPANADAIEKWIDRMSELKALAAQRTDKQIPEFQFLTVEDWLAAAREVDFSREVKVRAALSELRNAAKGHFLPLLQEALLAYLKTNGRVPSDVNLLGPYFSQPLLPGTLARYKMSYSGSLADLPVGQELIRETGAVDDYDDTLYTIGLKSSGMMGTGPKGAAIYQALKDYRAIHPGEIPNPEQIAPFLKEDIEPEYLADYLRHPPDVR
jgi:hypothetical protein